MEPDRQAVRGCNSDMSLPGGRIRWEPKLPLAYRLERLDQWICVQMLSREAASAAVVDE